MGIFLDTGFFLGLLHRKDPHHEHCSETFRIISSKKYGLIFTSSYVIAETATLILIRTKNHSQSLDFFWDLITRKKKFTQVLYANSYINALTWELFYKHNQGVTEKHHYLSFVDASNIIFCREHQISSICAVDGDFDAYLSRV